MTQSPSRSVAGKRVLVTAGASGIGLAIAAAFHDEGASVCVADVSDEHLSALVAARPGIGAFTCDVGNPEQVGSLFSRLTDRWDGRIDVLVNNAGISGPTAAIEDIAWRDWERTLRVNVGGMFLCIQAAIPLWRRNGGGTAINISSTSARTGLLERLPYVVSKVAVHGLTLNVARELGPLGVSCNALLPGMVDNERGRRLIEDAARQGGVSYDQAMAESLKYISMRSAIDPAEVGALCLHLASPAGARISGQLIGVCGNAEWE
jgi:NAD(P)-dependent dehydrogenase (short-subunit alcohol dehydrogenase family)